MRITIVLTNEDGTHEEIDNLANEIESLLDSDKYVNVESNDQTTSITITCETAEEEEEEE